MLISRRMAPAVSVLLMLLLLIGGASKLRAESLPTNTPVPRDLPPGWPTADANYRIRPFSVWLTAVWKES